MTGATFELNHVGVTKRFKLFLKDKDGKGVLFGQLREMKPMCLDEMKWIRRIADKNSSYERAHNEKGYFYIIRGGDGHELGRGNIYSSSEAVEEEISFIKEYAENADFVDLTPEEGRVRAYDYVVEKSSKLLHNTDTPFG